MTTTSPSIFRHIPKAIIILAMLGAALFLWTPSASAAPTITEFHVSNVGVPQGITAGPDSNLWFTEFYDNVAGRITPKGISTLFRLNTPNSATYITNGPDGALWLTLLNDVGGSTTNQIGRLTTSGKLTTFTVPKASYIWDITTVPDKNLYFTDGASRVWRVTTAGSFTAFPFTDKSGGYPYQITTGPDGNLWFTDRAHAVVKMSTSGKFTVFTMPADNNTTDDITAGPDGNLWFTLDGSSGTARIGRITPSGTITLFTLPNPNDSLYMSGISAGPDGNLWFTYQDFTTSKDAIGRITTNGKVTLTPTPTANSGPTDITPGPDGNMWFTEAVGNIGRITTS
jgi:streptogramin lyase